MLIRFKKDLYAPSAFLNICGVYICAAVATVLVLIVVGITGCALVISDALNPGTDLRMR
jgi:hypothetical protein